MTYPEQEFLEQIDRITLLQKNSKLEEAYTLLEKLILQYPDKPDLFNLKAELNLYNGNREEARNILLNLITLYPSHIKALNNLGDIYLELQDYPGAIEYFTKALAINPYDRTTVLKLGETLLKIKKYEHASRLYLNYLEVNYFDEEIYKLYKQLEQGTYIINLSITDERKTLLINKMVNLFGERILLFIEKWFKYKEVILFCCWIEDNLLLHFSNNYTNSIEESEILFSEVKNLLKRLIEKEDDYSYQKERC